MKENKITFWNSSNQNLESSSEINFRPKELKALRKEQIEKLDKGEELNDQLNPLNPDLQAKEEPV